MSEENKSVETTEENEETTEETTEETAEETSEETTEEEREEFEEEKDADYARDDIIEMLKSQKDSISEIKASIESIKDIVAVFVENGGTVREDVLDDENPVVEEDFGYDEISIDALDLSL